MSTRGGGDADQRIKAKIALNWKTFLHKRKHRKEVNEWTKRRTKRQRIKHRGRPEIRWGDEITFADKGCTKRVDRRKGRDVLVLHRMTATRI